MIASASVGEGKSYASKRPDATNGASWNGLAEERMKVKSPWIANRGDAACRRRTTTASEPAMAGLDAIARE